ncbi:hypothetical protein LUZ60_001772 [Juncus effusus]|nr:hypothetical protein LUZ60_001772 [Juncus effusus]
MGIHVVPDKVRAIWNEQEIRILVLLSLLLQILLIFLAPLRKHCTSKLFAFALWLFYLGADFIATVGLGCILSTQFDNNYNPQPNSEGELMAFWAPFMLLHLGGPDTITSFSQEDNDLWWRHLLSQIVQVSMCFLVLLSSSFSNRLLLAGSVLVFVAGLIKFAERTWAHRLASKKNVEGTIRSLSMLRSTPSEFLFPGSERLPEPLLISTAYYIFGKCCGIILLDNMNFSYDQYLIEECSFLFNLVSNTTQAFLIVEVELSFFHDILYTKASFLRSLNGIAWRCLTLMLVVAAVLLFQLSEKHGSKKSNLLITSILFFGGVVLEMVSILFLIFSDWTVYSLEERGFRGIARAISKATYCIFRKPKSRRSNTTMSQYNLISVYLRTNNSFMRRIMGILKLEGAWDKFWYVNHVRVPNKLKQMIVDNLSSYDMSSSIDKLIETKNLRRQVEFEKARFAVQLDVQNLDDILLWSIATQICYNTIVRETNDEVMMYRIVGHQLSNYMMDILAPELKDDIDSFYKNVKSIFDGLEQPDSEADVCNKLIDDFQKYPRNEFEHDLRMGLTRAKYMNELEAGLRWRLICFLWVDVLIVQAYRLGNEKIWGSEWLNNCGDLILNVWVLILHFKALKGE